MSRLAETLLRWRDRAASGVRRHPLIMDSALVALMVVFSRPRHGGVHGTDSNWGWLIIAGLLLPLVWRRRAPFVVFAFVAAAAFAQWLLEILLPADLALLVAFYTVAAYESRRRVFAAAAVLEVGAVLAAIRFGPHDNRPWAFVFISGLVIAAGVIGYNIRTRRGYLAALEDRAARLERERDREAQLAASAERARIAREMHDVVAHHIAVMIALADGAAYTTTIDPDQATTIMGQVSDTGRSALAEMRRLLGVMRDPGEAPGHAPQPTIADLDDLLSTVRAAGLPTRLTVSGKPVAVPPSAQLAVYRMVQEALTNTLKHADATHAQVRLTYRGDTVELEVTDDGATPATGTDGHGIAGMRERAAVFDADVEVGPKTGGGWRVHTVLQLAGAVRAADSGAVRA